MARPRGSKWIGDVYYKGKRRRASFDTKAEAEIWETQVQLAEKQDKPAPEARPRGSGGTTLGEYFERRARVIWRNAKVPEVQHRNMRVIHRYLGDPALEDIDNSTIQELITNELDDGKSGATVNRHMATLRKLMRDAFDEGVIKRVPKFPGQPEASAGKRRPFLKREEWERFEAAMLATVSEQAFIWYTYILLYGGFRYSEPRLSYRDDVAPDGIWVRDDISKTGIGRKVPIQNPKAQASIEKFLRGSNSRLPMFKTTDYRPYLEIWRSVVPRAGLENKQGMTPHILRHTAASWMVQRTKNLLVVRDFLGHKDIRTTQIYAKNDESDIIEAAALL